jgi:hypothetical protein
MRTPTEELKCLRLSVARLAQKLNVQTEALPVNDEDAMNLSNTKERGWNRLVMECIDEVDTMQEDAKERGYQE